MRKRRRPCEQALLVVALQLDDRVRGGGAARKDREHAVAQRFDDTAAVRLADAADPLRQPRDGLRGPRIPHGLEDPGTPRQVREYDCGIDTHIVVILDFSSDRCVEWSRRFAFPCKQFPRHATRQTRNGLHAILVDVVYTPVSTARMQPGHFSYVVLWKTKI
jgi:hypothetical protein